MKDRTKTILLFLSVIIMIVMFAMNVWDDLFHKNDETIRHEQEREARRLQREEWIKNMK
ncbi:hypothetical protein M2E15_3508 [Bacillus mycoides]|uniref:Uncharacterized protein n=1 Tax=Bacillus cereus VD048 TaxID=1053226 RepID=J8H8V9_BACCE|nr:hypothetical protein [Bacillus mycoides]AJH18250.1 hypothetical protein BG05_4965 [Bacillus mycoides]EJR29577.1 hypothetical protein IIG_03901 [Bacillus cereus VD048]KUH45582.1 hypothetical protein M2E15_3508 [Bacillus mycoides]MED1430512.1 hypothetical protein [Bacillus mycoides]